MSSSSDAGRPDSPETRVGQIAEEYLARLHAGARPDRAALLAAHADIAEALARRLDAVEVTHGLRPGGDGDETTAESERPTSPVRLTDLAVDTPLPRLKMGADKYQILEELGSGGMGRVYLAYDQDLDRRVALKMMRNATPETVRRFLDEAKVMAQLDHPHIVPVFEVGLINGQPFYTMRLVQGRSLADVLATLRAGDGGERRAYSLARRMQMFVQIGQALSYAHDRGVIHRDLKPTNVMLGTHGEVQVMDWGLSKVLRDGSVVTALGEPLTKTGHIVGTPHYMSPEQARGRAIDHRADVYALGVLLYELLTLTRPFEGPAMDVLAAIARDAPEAPHKRAGNVAMALEAVCLRALAKDPGDRPATVAEMLQPVQEWLEAEADKAKRHELAEAKAAEGRARLEEYLRLEREITALAAAAAETRGRFEPWQPASEKAALFAAEDAVRRAREHQVETATRCVAELEKALGFEDGNPTARAALADYYMQRFRDADGALIAADVAFFRDRVAEYHDGKYARELEGDGSLTLTTDPPGAEVWLYDLVEEGAILVERSERKLGMTPLAETPLPMGSYLVLLKKDGYRDTRYPVYIARNRAWTGQIRLHTDAEIGDGFVYVPGGPCILGGDPEAPDALARSEPVIDDFFIAEHPVTEAEYLEFLNDLARREGLAAAMARSPRSATDEPQTSYLVEDGADRLRLPEVDAEGDEWHPRHPVLGISWHDASAYCEWRSAHDGHSYRLPTEEEWEKAARGVDGRWFTWGRRFDPSLCNMRLSRKGRSSPVVVEDFPTDLSVYGVRGLGGNIRDWTSSADIEGRGPERRVSRVYRGGAWFSVARNCRAAYRYWNEPSNVSVFLGFRLARSTSISRTL